MVSIINRYHSMGWIMTASARTPNDGKPTAKLFMHGRSQAVRLPKEFRFVGNEVRVSKVGDKVILEPMENPPFDVDAWRAKLDAMGAEDFLPEGLPDDPPLMPDDTISFD